MKIKLDENLPTRLVDVLERRGHEVDTVATEGLTGKPDVMSGLSRAGRDAFSSHKTWTSRTFASSNPAHTRVYC